MLTEGTSITTVDLLLFGQQCKKNDAIQGQASWAKIMSCSGKLTAQACHLTKVVYKMSLLLYKN
jgi:hypothetical protein